jgi:hypothetical protein
MTEQIINLRLFVCRVIKQHSLMHGCVTNTGRFPNKVCVEFLGHVGCENSVLKTEGSFRPTCHYTGWRDKRTLVTNHQLSVTPPNSSPSPLKSAQTLYMRGQAPALNTVPKIQENMRITNMAEMRRFPFLRLLLPGM